MKRLAILAAFVLVARAWGDGLPTQPYIYVVGEAHRDVAPDELSQHFTLSFVDKDAAAARSQVAAQGKAVFDLFSRLQIPEADVTASSLSVFPQYDFNRAGSKGRTLDGYEVRREFAVKLHQLAGYPALVDGLIVLKVGQIETPTLSVHDRAKIEGELEREALQNARSNAERQASAMGMKVGGVFLLAPVAPTEIVGRIFPSDSEGPRGRGMVMEKFSVSASLGDRFVFEHQELAAKAHVIFLMTTGGQ